MGYANRRLRPANGNFNSRVLKPAKRENHLGFWVSGLLLLGIGAAAFGLVYIRNSKSGQSTEPYSDAHSQMKGRCGEVRLSDSEIRIRADAQRLKNSGRCDNDNTARAAAEAKEAMRNLFR